jgi:hypothetical protein
MTNADSSQRPDNSREGVGRGLAGLVFRLRLSRELPTGQLPCGSPVIV